MTVPERGAPPSVRGAPPNPGNGLLDAALGYAARGWPVLPLHGIHDGACTCRNPKCDKPGKHPRIKSGKAHSEATTDPDQIRAWWERWPCANVGIRTGAASVLIALDVDPRHGGEKSLAAVVNGSGLPKTPTVGTGGGGQHFLFAHPGRRIRNAVGFRPGLDLRGDGGLIVAPPSLHASGERYIWITSPDSVQLADAPAWLLNATRQKRSVVGSASTASQTPDAYAEAALQAECRRVRDASNGTRNDTLNRAGFSIGQLLGAGSLSRDRAERDLVEAATLCGLPEEEARRTIDSGLAAGELEPRVPRVLHRTCETPAPENPQGRPAPPNATDLGNAERFASQHSGSLHYCHSWKTWMSWDGRRWARDRTGEAVRRAEETVRAIYAEAAALDAEQSRKSLAAHAMRSEAQRSIASMLELAKADSRIAILPETFDTDETRHLFNALNGTLDLRTGQLLGHRQLDLITKLAPVTYEPSARCPTWEAFLTRVVPDEETRSFLRRFAGYSLTGDVGEQVFFLLYGPGANGKTTFVETLKFLYGEYAHKTDFETFLEGKSAKDRKGGPRPDLLDLAGRRLVIAVEASEGRHLDSSTIKEVTGGDTLTARGMYHRDQTSFRPQAKLLLATNHRPEIRDATEAIWRRVIEVPFAVTIPEAERDPRLLDRLREPGELSGILNWALEGCLEWQANTAPRLRPPAAVRKSTGSYRQDQDAIAPFLEARCAPDPHGRATNKELRAAYVAWCEEAEEDPIPERAFGRALEDHAFRRERGKDKKRTRGWAGIRLQDIFDQPVSDGSDGCAGF